MTRNKIITLVVIALIAGVALYLIFRKPKEKESLPSSPAEIKFPLKLGSTGSGVVAVQKYLNSKYGATLKVDGDWGPVTAASVLLHLKRDNISKEVFYKWELDKI